MFGMPLMAFSSGAATVFSITSADAPGYTAVTVTTGGAISGYCAIGSVRIAASPASTKNSAITAAKIGRSMKKREIMGSLLALRLGLGRCLVGRGGGGARRARRGSERNRCVGPQLGDTVDDDLIAGLESGLDDPQV